MFERLFRRQYSVLLLVVYLCFLVFKYICTCI